MTSRRWIRCKRKEIRKVNFSDCSPGDEDSVIFLDSFPEIEICC